MIYNCKQCCKSISTKSELCPYCKCDCSEIGLLFEKAMMHREHGQLEKFGTLKTKLKDSLAALKL